MIHTIGTLQTSLEEVRAEFSELGQGLGTPPSGFIFESSGLHSGSHWTTLVLAVNGQWNSTNCQTFFSTCEAVKRLPCPLSSSGQVKMSVLAPGAHVRPHFGPTNNRLRIHCTVFSGTDSSLDAKFSFLRVGQEKHGWKEGECFAFDEGFEHEAFHGQNASGYRVVLLVDIANPLLETENSFLDAVLASADVLKARQWFRELQALM
jgi:aspartate beta-hydroxylase